MRTVAILPVKTFGRAKQRLAGGFPNRPGLAEAMVADVLDALAQVDGLAEVIVVTAAPVSAPGAHVVHDPVEAGQSAAAALGIAAARERGAERVLLVPGDCPALDADEVSALLRHGEGVVIVPDRHGQGTNALLLTPPDVMEPAFGEGSFARHAARARAAGAALKVAEVRSRGRAVDPPADLAALGRARAAWPGGAARTRALLEEAAVA
jgi:2-phospho-L-lactate guanylyltransferase